MKKKLVDSVSDNEQHVRMQIYDGEITLDEAGKKLIEAETAAKEKLWQAYLKKCRSWNKLAHALEKIAENRSDEEAASIAIKVLKDEGIYEVIVNDPPPYLPA